MIREASSIQEARNFILLCTCPTCRLGLLYELDARQESESNHILKIVCQCNRCRFQAEYLFHIDPNRSSEDDDEASARPSELIDLGGWLILYQMKRQQADQSQDRISRREFNLQAASCIAEAVKFYDSDSELPPPEAFFSESGRALARSQPSFFLKERVLALRDQLPSEGLKPAPSRRKRSWWQVWKHKR